jgi:hypothetical protein
MMRKIGKAKRGLGVGVKLGFNFDMERDKIKGIALPEIDKSSQ